MPDTFAQLNLHPQLLQSITALGYTTPTPIQAAVIPVMLAGRDVIGQAQTGTGKTAAFSLPLLHNLHHSRRSIQGLVLTPTRELAQQVAKAMDDYGRTIGARVIPIYGGQPYRYQIERLRKGVDVVVGTPGRLLDLVRRNVLDLASVSSVVLDEADEMLSMGFISDIQAILEETPSTHQTSLFSATLPLEVRRLATRYMHSPQSCTIGSQQLTVATVEQRFYLVNQRDKLAALTRLLEVERSSSALIFVRTRLSTGILANELAEFGLLAEALSGELGQSMRERVLHRFRTNQISVLVATDVAARGLDIDDISHVVNYDMPQDPEVYVHRVGRTARGGKTGIALSLVTPEERHVLHRIETYTKQKITRSPVPTVEAIQQYRESELVKQLTTWLRRGRYSSEREIVARLIQDGSHDPVEVAAAALRMARRDEKQRPIKPIEEVQERRQRTWQPDSRRSVIGRNTHQGRGSRSRNQGAFSSSLAVEHRGRPLSGRMAKKNSLRGK
nr:DEAD/DEAH box helicase [Deltaproteobacteria bacterium]